MVELVREFTTATGQKHARHGAQHQWRIGRRQSAPLGRDGLGATIDRLQAANGGQRGFRTASPGALFGEPLTWGGRPSTVSTDDS